MSVPPAPTHRHEGRVARLAHRLVENNPSPVLLRRSRLAMTLGPLIGFGGILLGAFIVAGRETPIWLLGAEIGSFIGLGKFVIYGGIFRDVVARIVGYVPRGSPPSLWVLAGLVVYGDLATTLVMMANMTLLYRTPFIGRRLAACHVAGWYVLRVHRWMRRMAWLGVAVFIAAPFQGTGAVIGTILARLLGLSRLATFSATLVGSTAGCLALALLGTYGRKRVEQIARHPVAAAVVLAVTVVMLIVIGRWLTGESARVHDRAAGLQDEEPR